MKPSIVILGLLFSFQVFAETFEQSAAEINAALAAAANELSEQGPQPILSVTKKQSPEGTEYLIRTSSCAVVAVVTYTHGQTVPEPTSPQMQVSVKPGFCNQTGFSVGSH